MLTKRSDMKVPIDSLSLEECLGVRTSQMRQLGELVVNLKVDWKVIDVKELDFDDDLNDENRDNVIREVPEGGDSDEDYSDSDP